MEDITGDVRDGEFINTVLAYTSDKEGSVHCELDLDLDPFWMAINGNVVRCGVACFEDLKGFMAARMAREN